MPLILKVPNLESPNCVETVTEAITTMEPDAKVEVNLEAKTVSVESEASEETIKQSIIAAGYTVEGY